MKVKVGHLKTHLSSYLREIQKTGETLEVCVRETPIAYLMPVGHGIEPSEGVNIELLQKLRSDGIAVSPARQPKGNWVPKPGKAGDGKIVCNSVVSMRKEKDW